VWVRASNLFSMSMFNTLIRTAAYVKAFSCPYFIGLRSAA
jgi:hypothetical protein